MPALTTKQAMRLFGLSLIILAAFLVGVGFRELFT